MHSHFTPSGSVISTWHDASIILPPGAHGEIRRRCPQCDPGQRRGQSLAINADKGVWHCHRCGWSGRLGGERRTAPPPPPDPKQQQHDMQRQRAKIRTLWRGAVPLADPGAEIGRRYLIARGLQALIDRADLPADIRLHPAADYWSTAGDRPRYVGDYPTVLALVRGPLGQPVAVHRTYLDPSGAGKAKVSSPKKMLRGAPREALRGAAIRLYAAGETLAVAEGVETALALRAAMPAVPVWSCVDAHGLEKVELPETVHLVIVAADNDAHHVGQHAALRLAERLIRLGRRARVIVPPTAGSDWLDVLQEVVR